MCVEGVHYARHFVIEWKDALGIIPLETKRFLNSHIRSISCKINTKKEHKIKHGADLGSRRHPMCVRKHTNSKGCYFDIMNESNNQNRKPKNYIGK